MAALSLFFLFLLDSLCIIVVLTAARAHSDPLVLRLHRRYVPGDTTEIRLDHLKELLRNDRLRQHMIRGRIMQQVQQDSFRMPLRSGAYTRTGQYFVQLQLGTPPQQFLVVADTGSDLTWVNCMSQSEGSAQGQAFLPNKSSSFKPIPCSSAMCKTSLPFSLAACPSPASPCAYDYRYFGGSSALGSYANESATVTLASGSTEELQGLVVGCTSSATGPSFQAADGVLGLGYSDISFGVHATARFGGLFSYCLVDHLSPQNVSSFLSFGGTAGTVEGELQETPLVVQPELGPFYYVKVEGISVDGNMLSIPASVWDTNVGGGTIVDSGTSLMVLAEPAYRAVATALSRRLAEVPQVSLDPFEHCYNWTKRVQGGSAPPPLPTMEVYFSGGARLEPPAKSYVIDAADGIKCLGIVSTPWPGTSTIGNIMQQEHQWVFDVRNRRLRFGSSTCRA